MSADAFGPRPLARNRSQALRLTPGCLRALGDLSRRHPLAEALVETFDDEAGVGWCGVKFAERTGRSRDPIAEHHYVCSSTGRAWASEDGVRRLHEVREADYAEAGR